MAMDRLAIHVFVEMLSLEFSCKGSADFAMVVCVFLPYYFTELALDLGIFLESSCCSWIGDLVVIFYGGVVGIRELSIGLSPFPILKMLSADLFGARVGSSNITICKCKGKKCHSFCVYLGMSFSLYMGRFRKLSGVSISLIDLVSWSVILLG
ncbi:hypothetical protein DVH24_030560 [Malus domestica]|uniref:Uncharacterized protein n=1 Tax=Malus domestica TaxID=3750 RepID=A0A498JVY2_MALDO|nr:hypothetical protein DVH24_030560 [Malus domestica]